MSATWTAEMLIAITQENSQLILYLGAKCVAFWDAKSNPWVKKTPMYSLAKAQRLKCFHVLVETSYKIPYERYAFLDIALNFSNE